MRALISPTFELVYSTEVAWEGIYLTPSDYGEACKSEAIPPDAERGPLECACAPQ